jgi:hypothetical protein
VNVTLPPKLVIGERGVAGNMVRPGMYSREKQPSAGGEIRNPKYEIRNES